MKMEVLLLLSPFYLHPLPRKTRAFDYLSRENHVAKVNEYADADDELPNLDGGDELRDRARHSHFHRPKEVVAEKQRR